MIYKRKDGDREYFQYLQVENGKYRWFDFEYTGYWFDDPTWNLEEEPDYEPTDLTYETAILIDSL